LKAARAMLSDDGFILLTKTQPIRHALRKAQMPTESLKINFI
jgi:hypothetical protein